MFVCSRYGGLEERGRVRRSEARPARSALARRRGFGSNVSDVFVGKYESVDIFYSSRCLRPERRPRERRAGPSPPRTHRTHDSHGIHGTHGTHGTLGSHNTHSNPVSASPHAAVGPQPHGERGRRGRT